MTKPALLFLICLLTFSKPHAQQNRRLVRKVQKLVQNFKGDVGIYVKNLKTGKTVVLNADTLFPTASMVKIPILIGVMDKMARAELSYQQELVYRDSLLYEGVDILGSFKDSERIELGKVLMLMLSMSDNTASLWLQSLAGGGVRINTLLDSMGFSKTRVNSRTPGREANRTAFGWGQTTPREMATLLEKIYRHEAVSVGASDRMLRSLNRNFWDSHAIGQLPPYATVFSKNGAVDASRSEVVLVRGVKSAYLFCICTKNNVDESWLSTNEAWQLTEKLSAMLWRYFERKDRWKPAPDAAKFK